MAQLAHPREAAGIEVQFALTRQTLSALPLMSQDCCHNCTAFTMGLVDEGVYLRDIEGVKGHCIQFNLETSVIDHCPKFEDQRPSTWLEDHRRAYKERHGGG